VDLLKAKMSTIQALKDLGESIIGLKGTELREFIKEQQDLARKERAKQREYDEKQHEYQKEREKEQMEYEKEREKQKLDIMKEQRDYELEKLRIEQQNGNRT